MSYKIENVAVIGGGLMGSSIAYVFSSQYKVAVYDTAPIDLHSAIRETTQELAANGIVTPQELERRLSQIRLIPEMDDNAISNADLVVEAVYENMELKRGTFAKLERICRDDCIFCTNTSVMSPSEISRDLEHRERFAGTHFWNPAHLIPLVEVVMSDATSGETAHTVMETLAKIGKRPVLCKKDVPGFIANRLQHALWREAMYLVENGIADAQTVDDACKYGPGLRWPVLGPLENSDLVGIELTYNIHDYVLKSLADNHEPSPLLREMMDRGDLGMKSGRGWLEWAPEDVIKLNSRLREHLIDLTSK